MSCGVLYNGEIHFIGNEYKYHKVWDGGATVRDLNQLPENIYRSFVYQNRLCAYCQSTGTIYAWNESEDTWEIFAENILSSYYPQTYVINGDLYFVQNKDVYRFENGSAPKIYALSLGGKYLPRTKGNCFYYYNLGSTGQNLYKFDVVNGVETKLGGFPVAKLTFQGFTDVDTDNFTFIMGSNDGFTEFEMFEI